MKLALISEMSKQTQSSGTTDTTPKSSVLSFASTARLEKFRRKAQKLQKLRKLEKEKDSVLEEVQNLPKIFDAKGIDVTPRPLLSREDASRGYVFKLSRTFLAGSCVDVVRISNSLCELNASKTAPTKMSDLRAMSEKSQTIKQMPPVVSSMDTKGYIILKESDTDWIYDMPPTSVIESQEEYEKVKQKNEDYNKYLQRHKDGEAVNNVSTQTIILPTKSKIQQTQSIFHRSCETIASEVLIHDTYLELNKEDHMKKMDKSLISTQALATEGLTTDNIYEISKSSLLQKLVILERAINCTTYRNIIDKFKEVSFPHKDILPTIKLPKTSLEKEIEKEEPVEEEKQTVILEKLLTFKCRFIEDYTVTSISWNKENTDLLAVGYKYKILPATSRGLVCGWNIKNCKAPERTFVTHYGVTCVKFCEAAAYLLAVGMHEGGLAIYDLRTVRSKNAIAHNFKSSYRPVGTVWDLQWTAKDTGHKGIKHLITTISEDGSVIQWTLQNALEGIVLMRLRNASNVSLSKERRLVSSYLSQYASGYSLQCSSLDKNIYLVSTNDGNIYKCSTLYSERHLITYDLHYGPVYCIQYCPLEQDKFLSCGNDGTIAFWSDNDTTPYMVVKASQRYCAIIDAAWSFTSPNVFAAISLSYLETWNTKLSQLEPIATAKIAVDKHLTCVTFCPTGDIIAVGDSNGIVVFYIFHNPETLKED